METESFANVGRCNPDGVVEFEGDRETKWSVVTGDFVGRH